MTLRYFYEQVPELHVIAAGSLLEFVMGDIPVPVGRVQHLHLYPMTFREYLLGQGTRSLRSGSSSIRRRWTSPCSARC